MLLRQYVSMYFGSQTSPSTRHGRNRKPPGPISQTVVVGDAPNDIYCARHAGLQVVVVTHRMERDELLEHSPDAILDSLARAPLLTRFKHSPVQLTEARQFGSVREAPERDARCATVRFSLADVGGRAWTVGSAAPGIRRIGDGQRGPAAG